MSKEKSKQNFIESTKCYDSFLKKINTDDDDINDSFWREEVMSVDNLSAYRLSVNSQDINKAMENSKHISQIIEDEGETSKSICMVVAFYLTIILVSAGLVVALTLTMQHRNGIADSNKKMIMLRSQIDSNYIPLFFNVPGTSASIIPSALSSCLGLTEAKLGGSIRNDDFVTTTSLCGVSSTSKEDTNVKLFLLLENPILQIPLSYIEMKDPYSIFYDPRLKDLTFQEYVTNNTLFEKDVLIKRLLCRQKDDTRALTEYSVKRAKTILKRSKIGLFQDYNNSFFQFKKAFHHWDFLSSPSVDECVEKHFKSELKKSEELYRKHGIEFHRYYNMLKEANKFDMELYTYIAYSSISMN